MNNISKGVLLGAITGVIDVTPMILMKLSWDANLSAFSMWVVIGFLISTTQIKINRVLKGILISFLVLTPTAFLIGWHNPADLVPIVSMTMILGGLLGYFIGSLK